MLKLFDGLGIDPGGLVPRQVSGPSNHKRR